MSVCVRFFPFLSCFTLSDNWHMQRRDVFPFHSPRPHGDPACKPTRWAGARGNNTNSPLRRITVAIGQTSSLIQPNPSGSLPFTCQSQLLFIPLASPKEDLRGIKNYPHGVKNNKNKIIHKLLRDVIKRQNSMRAIERIDERSAHRLHREGEGREKKIEKHRATVWLTSK